MADETSALLPSTSDVSVYRHIAIHEGRRFDTHDITKTDKMADETSTLLPLTSDVSTPLYNDFFTNDNE